jgi:hypothetical protein
MTKAVQVSVGDELFAEGSTEAFGAVRHVSEHEHIIDIEGYGDTTLAAASVVAVHDHKVIVDIESLPDDIRTAIAHAHDREER